MKEHHDEYTRVDSTRPPQPNIDAGQNTLASATVSDAQKRNQPCLDRWRAAIQEARGSHDGPYANPNHDPAECGCENHAPWCPFNPHATEVAPYPLPPPASVSDAQVSHSPLPWIIWSQENTEGTLWSVCHHVGDMMSNDHACVADVEGVDRPNARANAEYIVRAANSYPALVSALKALRAVHFYSNCDIPECGCISSGLAEQVDAALKLAEAEVK